MAYSRETEAGGPRGVKASVGSTTAWATQWNYGKQTDTQKTTKLKMKGGKRFEIRNHERVGLAVLIQK